jgi:hypothetical protein
MVGETLGFRYLNFDDGVARAAAAADPAGFSDGLGDPAILDEVGQRRMEWVVGWNATREAHSTAQVQIRVTAAPARPMPRGFALDA